MSRQRVSKWLNLKDNKCPMCGHLLNLTIYNDDIHICTNPECGFTISSQKFDLIVENSYKHGDREGSTEEDNLEALNNLGHDLIAEDFSDSPHADRA